MSNSNSTLTAERLRSLVSYDPETGLFTWLVSRGCVKAGHTSGWTDQHGRVFLSVDFKWRRAHRLAWLYMTGEWPKEEIDHINGNPSDNRFCNLREATRMENQQNIRKARSDSTSKLIGARPHQGRWRADIRVNKKKYFLGSFETAEAAHEAYVKAKRELHPFGTL